MTYVPILRFDMSIVALKELSDSTDACVTLCIPAEFWTTITMIDHIYICTVVGI